MRSTSNWVPDRSISIHNAAGRVHVIVDLNGYFVSDGSPGGRSFGGELGREQSQHLGVTGRRPPFRASRIRRWATGA